MHQTNHDHSGPMKPRIVLIGPPGVGKGTQAAILSRIWAVPTLSTGAMFRAELEKGSPLGEQVRHVLESGGLVEDVIVNAVVDAHLNNIPVSAGFILDGYPRTAMQAHRLNHQLARSRSLDAAVIFACDRATLRDRISSREHSESRTDNAPHTIEDRIDRYLQELSAIEATYTDQGLVRQIDAAKPVPDVTQDIIDALRRPRS